MNLLTKIWYHKHPLFYLLIPFSGLYRSALFFKNHLYKLHLKKITRPPVPTIIVGNLSVGGTGKTPLIILLAQFLSENGYKPGIVSRGYGGKPSQLPLHVHPTSDPLQAGDEPVLMARKTNRPVVVDPNRVRAVRALLANYDCDVILSDDGLQHTALGRDIEIVVVDGERYFGNGWCLPAGPLREPMKRLEKVDFVVIKTNVGWIRGDFHRNPPNSKDDFGQKKSYLSLVDYDKNGLIHPTYSMNLVPKQLYNLTQPTQPFPTSHNNHPIHAVAGIGNPKPFFHHLRNLGLNIIEHPFPDHHHYTPKDLDFGPNTLIIMTEKDAVKCEKFAQNNYWCLPVLADCASMPDLLLSKLKLQILR